MKKIKAVLYVSYLFFPFYGVSQLTNEGMMYVNDQTTLSSNEDFINRQTGTFINDGNTILFGNYLNDGILDFYGEEGIIQFTGGSPQFIDGSETSNLNHVRFSNGSDDIPFYLANTWNIFGTVDFLDGIVDNDSYGGNMVFMENALHINTSDASFVDGTVIKNGPEDFRFPTGDLGYYRYAEISMIPDTDTFRVKYYFENSDPLYDHGLRDDNISFINTTEYWQISSLNDQKDFWISLPWSGNTTSNEIIGSTQNGNVVIVRWDSAQNVWINEGGVVNINERTVSTQVSSDGIFTMAKINDGDGIPCGVEVFNAISTNDDAKNDFFLIDGLSNQPCVGNAVVRIYNRWGIKVYESNDYGENGDVFRGFSSGNLTFQNRKKLPSGTYFYTLELEYLADSGEMGIFKKMDYLFLNDGN